MKPNPSLLDQLCSLDHLYSAWQNLNKTNPLSFGLSGNSLEQFKNNIGQNLKALSEQLKSNTFRFSDTRAYLVPKDNGDFRPLQIPEVKGRVVLKGIAILLEKLLQPILRKGEGVSFAYQKGLGIQQALERLKDQYQQGNTVIFEADIIDFFGTVDRTKIIGQVIGLLPDSSLNDLIKAGLSQNVGGLDAIAEDHKHKFADKGGIPQGNALSPLLSNVYLSSFDEIMKEHGFSLIRYADDFVITCRTFQEANNAYSFAANYLKKELGLEIHALSSEPGAKTRILDPTTETFSFLSISFDGAELFPSLKNKDKFLRNIADICTKSSYPIITSLIKVKNSHDGWISNYLFTDVARYFIEIDALINHYLYRLLYRNEWKIQRTTLAILPTSLRNRFQGKVSSGHSLSVTQRKTSGIPLSIDLYEKRKKSDVARQIK